MEYYYKSADQGYDDALFNLGELYREGDYVKQDYKKAIEYFQKAAQ
ncbi:unnamed protein product [Commensalibacter communis]|nr:SEL1-like repeat protein [Commensalibacter communis]CAI3952483.1 unnamed protein product [Commensalibacter communis]